MLDQAETPEPGSVLTEMEAQAEKVAEAANALLGLQGEVRDSEIAEWNSNLKAIEEQLFEILQQQAKNGISDDLAPILEEIRECFELKVAPEAAAEG
ncbi:MAG: hypothetical protein AAF585_24035 [Verrucomicrobiota bacterium]